MDSPAPHPDWVLQPLLDLGLGVERIRTLVYRLSFEVVVRDGHPSVAHLRAVVADEPPAVRRAWTEVIGRLIA
ncbi:hypothetical protein ACI79D_19605 [Geodermatophilus sp. SYSU D00708]